ncbi:hypothetical protein [Haladaptatus cibarius]|uniref:hypothetical protein n=1 Tax=Haladaptatus cibarius TaxID=453847 RepID=UPI0006791DFB|nr:hypothetical protein [Haladaptatus cibarius]
MSDDSRADRLRRRRRAQRDQQTERDQSDDTADTADPDDTTDPDDVSDEQDRPSTSDEASPEAELIEKDSLDESPGQGSVKDARVGTYMYLPETQRSELNFRYKELNLAYERAFGDELEKNRHFYPLVVQAGLDALDGLDGKDVQELLKQLE